MAVIIDMISPMEDAIITRLEQATAKRVLVQPYPDDVENWEPTHPVGALLVRYNAGDYSDTRDTSLVAQDREMQFEVTLAMWSLRDRKGGIYSYMELVRAVLTGFLPPNATRKFTPISEGFVGRGGGVKNKSKRLWQYQIMFKTETLNIEQVIEPDDPLLVRITTIDQTLNITTEVP